MNTHDFCSHRLFFALQPDLSLPVTTALARLYAEWVYDGPEDLYDDVRERVYERTLLSATTEEDHRRLLLWIGQTPVKEFVAALAQQFWARLPAHTPRPATEGQLRIITEAQVDVGVDFSLYFAQLTSWQADTVLKGLFVISEVLRCTGDRHFQPRDLRRAVREYIDRHPELASGQRLPRSSPSEGAR